MNGIQDQLRLEEENMIQREIIAGTISGILLHCGWFSVEWTLRPFPG